MVAELLAEGWAWAALFGVAAVLLLLYARRLSRRLRDERSRGQSLATRYGQITEQFAPLLADYPHDPKGFRFLGTPVDGVQFNEDEVVFVEIKAADSRLSERQRRVRDLVEAGKVRWMEFRLR